MAIVLLIYFFIGIIIPFATVYLGCNCLTAQLKLAGRRVIFAVPAVSPVLNVIDYDNKGRRYT